MRWGMFRCEHFKLRHYLQEGCTARYNINRLVWYQIFGDVHSAIAREKQLKRWRREKKIQLIETRNPTWQDLSAEWGKPISWQDINRRSLDSGLKSSARDDKSEGLSTNAER